eukprot:SAG22_NODE_698_length_7809_cov_2.743061_3_plen_204_part_00
MIEKVNALEFTHMNMSCRHHLSGFTIDIVKAGNASAANFGILAPGIVRSNFDQLRVSGAGSAGLFMHGWINTVVGCAFWYSAMGLLMSGQSNANSIVGSQFEHQNGIGLVIMGGEMVNCNRNTFEGNLGPGVVAIGVSGLVLEGNYFVSAVQYNTVHSPLPCSRAVWGHACLLVRNNLTVRCCCVGHRKVTALARRPCCSRLT